MAKDKKAKEEKVVAKPSNGYSFRVAQRQEQSRKDREIAVKQDGWKAKKTVEDKDRCGACRRPSAVVRRGAQFCTRCQGEPARNRSRQKSRDLMGNQPRVKSTFRSGPPLSPLAAALHALPPASAPLAA